MKPRAEQQPRVTPSLYKRCKGTAGNDGEAIGREKCWNLSRQIRHTRSKSVIEKTSWELETVFSRAFLFYCWTEDAFSARSWNPQKARMSTHWDLTLLSNWESAIEIRPESRITPELFLFLGQASLLPIAQEHLIFSLIGRHGCLQQCVLLGCLPSHTVLGADSQCGLTKNWVDTTSKGSVAWEGWDCAVLGRGSRHALGSALQQCHTFPSQYRKRL